MAALPEITGVNERDKIEMCPEVNCEEGSTALIMQSSVALLSAGEANSPVRNANSSSLLGDVKGTRV